MGQFNIPPVSTLLGSTLPNFFRVLKQGHVDIKYYHKIFLTFLVILIATPFHLWESLIFRIRLSGVRFKKPPLFILGHWRSGTTLLHTMLCKDSAAAYVTTYQSTFPNNLTSKWLFKTFMALEMPRRRPSDNMPLDANLPQEEELAFANCQPNAYYTFFYFPSQYQSFYDKSVHHKGLKSKEIKFWYKIYDKLLKKAYVNTGGDRLIIKNPVNTARIKHILKLYPDARFLYIYRNPFTVHLSTIKFLEKLLPTVTLSKFDNECIEEMAFDIYCRLLNDYQEQKTMIPAGNLLEIKYEEFENDPFKYMEKIYSQLLAENFTKVREQLKAYYASSKSYVKNKYIIDRESMNKIKQRLEKYIKLYDYDIPRDVIIQ